MHTIRVAVLRGGTSPQYMMSLKTGAAILETLRADERYQALDIFIAKDGIWHLHGKPIEPGRLFGHVDVVWNALHGAYGEDGKIAKEIQMLGIPYIGSSPFAASQVSNKEIAKKRFEALGIATPQALSVRTGTQQEAEQIAMEVMKKIAPPWVVKPLHGGSSINMQLARSFPELVLALTNQEERYGDVLVEQFLTGREFHIGTISGLRGEDRYATHLIELKKDEPILSCDMRTEGGYTCLLPKDMSYEERDALIRAAHTISEDIGLSGFTSFDFIKTARGTYLLEVDDIPELHEHAPTRKALSESGISLGELAHHLITEALEKNTIV